MKAVLHAGPARSATPASSRRRQEPARAAAIMAGSTRMMVQRQTIRATFGSVASPTLGRLAAPDSTGQSSPNGIAQLKLPGIQPFPASYVPDLAGKISAYNGLCIEYETKPTANLARERKTALAEIRTAYDATPAWRRNLAEINDLQQAIDKEDGDLDQIIGTYEAQAMRGAMSDEPLKNKLPDPLVSIIGGYLAGPAKPSS